MGLSGVGELTGVIGVALRGVGELICAIGVLGGL